MRLRGGELPDFTGAPPFVLVCALLSSMDSMLLGYDIGCVSGIIPFVQADFGLSNHQIETFASAMNSAAVVGALVSGYAMVKWFTFLGGLFPDAATSAIELVKKVFVNQMVLYPASTPDFSRL